MAAPVGFEPTRVGTKIRCLSAWRRGNGGGGGIRTPELERSGLQPPAFGRFATPPNLRLLIYYIKLIIIFFKNISNICSNYKTQGFFYKK